MNKRILLLGITILSLASCKEHETAITQSEIHAKVDSLIAIKLEELNKQAMEDLDRRKSIEVKAKADSIVQARMRPDTTVAPQPAPQP